MTSAQKQTLKLPRPTLRGEVSAEEALARRRSVREYSRKPLTLEEISQLLWAAQGVTGPDGERTAPSAGALYPIELYVAVGNVGGLAPGLYRYRPRTHRLDAVVAGRDLRAKLSEASLDQKCVKNGAAVVVIAAVYERTTRKYGESGRSYAQMEVGHVSQNIYIQAAALGLGTVTVGAFEEDEVGEILGLSESETPLALMPIGRSND